MMARLFLSLTKPRRVVYEASMKTLLKTTFWTTLSFYLTQTMIYAKPIGDAVRDEVDSQSLDPAGFRLMLMCIGMLVLLVVSLFAGTMFYFLKGKKDKKG
jgi:hypothetical protein